MKKKVILSILLAICMGVAAGCGGGTGGTEQATNQQKESEQVANDQQVAEEQDTISFKKEAEQVTNDQQVAEEQDTTSFKVDWNKCQEDLKGELLSDSYAYVQDIALIVNDEDKKITLTAILDDSVSPEMALEFADTLIRRTNSLANMQDSNVAPCGADSYGGVFDAYDCLIGIASASQVNNSAQWFVYDAIARGTNQKLDLNDTYKS